MQGGKHLPVLLEEVMQFLDCRPDRIYVDATVGSGGHARRILEKSSPTGRVIGLDWDAAALARTREALAPFGDRFHLVQSNFRDLKEVLDSLAIKAVDGILADLGLSSEQLEDPERGFSFQKDAPLDMRMDLRRGLMAGDLIRRSTGEEMTRILREFGEERWANRIAKAIILRRRLGPLSTTGALVEVIRKSIPAYYSRIHPATRTFQALRIAVNEELDNLENFLKTCPDLLNPGGRIAIISFHSLEERIVKSYFQQRAKREKGRPGLFRILTRKPLVPSAGEIRSNPRARSAKLRVMEKISEPIERGEHGGSNF